MDIVTGRKYRVTFDEPSSGFRVGDIVTAVDVKGDSNTVFLTKTPGWLPGDFRPRWSAGYSAWLDKKHLVAVEAIYTAADVEALIRKGAEQEGLCKAGVDRFLRAEGLIAPARRRVVIEFDDTDVLSGQRVESAPFAQYLTGTKHASGITNITIVFDTEV